MRTLTLLALTTAALSVPAVPAWASADSCHGHTATHVGAPGGDLVGTPERDVVVTNGAASTVTGDGDDLVCVTGDSGKKRRVKVGTGNGTDEVHVTAEDDTFVVLGAGEDVFAGGPQDDTVYAGLLEQGEDFDEATDTIDTGGGADGVVSGSGGLVNADALALGGGDDFANVAGTTASVAGGAGSNTLRLNTDEAGDPRLWYFDNSRGQASRDGDLRYTWTGFTDFDLTHVGYSTRVTVNGSERPEAFYLAGRGSDAGRVEVYARGGNDVVTVSSSTRGFLLGSAGRDRLQVESDGCTTGTLRLDLTAGWTRATCAGSTRQFRTRSFDDATVTGFAATAILGSERDNRLEVNQSCQIDVLGDDGSDRLDVLGYFLTNCGHFGAPAAQARLDGGDGTDHLSGGRYGDLLIGGPGHDRADGEGGRDRCDAELRLNCERR